MFFSFQKGHFDNFDLVVFVFRAHFIKSIQFQENSRLYVFLILEAKIRENGVNGGIINSLFDILTCIASGILRIARILILYQQAGCLLLLFLRSEIYSQAQCSRITVSNTLSFTTYEPYHIKHDSSKRSKDK